jgi:hypothetical protein
VIEIQEKIREVLTFKGKAKNSLEMIVFIMCLKSMKKKLPKYLLFKIFDDLEEVYFLADNFIAPFSNHKLGEKKFFPTKSFLFIKGTIFDNEERLISVILDKKVDLKLFFFI